MDSPAPVRFDEDTAWTALLALRRFFASGRGRSAAVRLGPGGEVSVAEEICPEAVLKVDGRGWSSVQPLDPAVAQLFDLYLPVCRTARDWMAVGHLGQSLDGRIATASGASRYVNGPENLVHLHRLRALADAVLVGAGTVRCDDPRLTVHNCSGPSPLRVVIDTECRLDAGHTLFSDGAAPTLVFSAADRCPGGAVGQAERIGVPRQDGGLDLSAVVEALAARGVALLFVEGGGVTVSRFLQEGRLDRLQITVAPVLIGSGRPGITLPEIATMDDALRPPTRWFALGRDMLCECIFRA
jgi:riboflavin-specific deaminase-like protein